MIARVRIRLRLSRRPWGIAIVQLAGMAGIVAGVWQVYEPAAWIIGGLGAVLAAQGWATTEDR